ncbi:Uncharacterised protein [Vibrio cholerae]|nr:Uncharacterised protein [Vibrio cholerae]
MTNQTHADPTDQFLSRVIPLKQIAETLHRRNHFGSFRFPPALIMAQITLITNVAILLP